MLLGSTRHTPMCVVPTVQTEWRGSAVCSSVRSTRNLALGVAPSGRAEASVNER